MRRFVILLAVVIAGCGERNPISSRFASGEEAMIHSRDGDFAWVEAPDLSRVPQLDNGTKVRVVSDSAKDEGIYRWVIILPLEREWSHGPVKIYRQYLSPLP